MNPRKSCIVKRITKCGAASAGTNGTGCPMSKRVPLTRGLFAIIDDEDYDEISQYQWYASQTYNRYYASRDFKIKGVRFHEKMHRIIMGSPKGLEIDHINGDGLDNRKENLRIVTHRQNHWNRHTPKTSRFPGVSYVPKDNRWRVKIQINGVNKHIGCYSSEEEAALVYKKVCSQLVES